METDGETLMSAAELKPLLRLSRRRPISCAICLTKDGVGLVLLNRRVKPRRVLAQMRKEAKESGLALNLPLLRFGRARVDGASDSMKVTFTVNKPAPDAMRRALLQQLRPAGYQRCEVGVDEALETETEEGEEGDGDDDLYGADAGVLTGAALHPAQVVAQVAAQSGGAPEPGAADAAALRGVLAGLVHELAPVVAHEPARARPLVGLAVEGKTELEHGDVRGAARSIEKLKAALHPEGGGAVKRGSQGGPGGAGSAGQDSVD